MKLFKRKRSIQKTELSELLKDQWIVALDPKDFTFKMLPKKEIKNGKPMAIKELSLKECQMFGVDSTFTTSSQRRKMRDDEFFSCVPCDIWLDGLCVKHPLIFVKEEIPPNMPYTVLQTFPHFLHLAPSTIPGAGMGVYTIIDLPAGVSFGPYSGILSYKTESEKSGYSWQILCPDSSRVWVDAVQDEYSNWMRYSNCARFEQEQNLAALLYNQNIYYYTYKPVPANSELLTWYGADYGKCLKIPGAGKMRGSKAPTKKVQRKRTSFFK